MAFENNPDQTAPSRHYDDLHVGATLSASDQPPAGVPELLETLTDLVERSRSMPMSSSVLVNRTEALELLDQIHEALPHQLTHADEVLSDADETLVNAKTQADALLAAAQTEAQRLVSHEQIVGEAREVAQTLVTKAEHEAANLRKEADDYCDRRLAEFEIDLGRILAQVQAGRAKLAGRLD